MTLQEKIKKLVEGTAALHTPTQEIYDKLNNELEKHGYTWGVEIYNSFWKDYAEGTYVGYSYGTLDYGDKSSYQDEGMSILELTLADFPEITQVTIIGDTTVQMKAKITKGDNGYTIEKLVEPKFSVGEIVMNCNGQVVKIMDIRDGHYKFQWYNGIVHEQPFEVVEGNFKRLPW